jgi:hypothetical protein
VIRFLRFQVIINSLQSATPKRILVPRGVRGALAQESEQGDPFEDYIHGAGLGNFFDAHPELKDVARKAFQTHPLIARAEVQLQDEWHGHLLKHREWLAEVGHQGAAAYDRVLITLASGAIALSITFLEKFSTPGIPGTLLLAWGAMLVSIVLTVASMATSRALVRAEVAAVDNLIKNPPSYLEKPQRDERLPKRSKHLDRTTTTLSVLASLAFVAGLLGLMFFAASRREVADGREAEAAAATEGEDGLRAPSASSAAGAEGEEGLRAAASSSAAAQAPTGEAGEVVGREKEDSGAERATTPGEVSHGSEEAASEAAVGEAAAEAAREAGPRAPADSAAPTTSPPAGEAGEVVERGKEDDGKGEGATPRTAP